MCNLERLHPHGDSGGIQTHDLQNRNLTLYSAKLRNHCDFAVANLRKLFQTDERLQHKKRAEQTFSLKFLIFFLCINKFSYICSRKKPIAY